MVQIKIQSAASALIVSGKAIDGATLHGTAIGLVRNTAAAITADRNGFITERTAHENAKAAAKADRMVRNALLKTARAWTRLTRDLLKTHLGVQHNANWTAAGFQKSLMVPVSADKVVLVLEALGEFLAGRPDLENEALNITAAQATTLATNLATAQNRLKNKIVVVKDAQAAKNRKYQALRKRIRSLITELNLVLDPLDNRWTDFGLNRPGALIAPPTPAKVTAAVYGAAVKAKWEPTPRAEYYRVWKKVDGADEEYVFVGTTKETFILIEDLPSASKVFVIVAAVNNGGESAKSEAADVTTP